MSAPTAIRRLEKKWCTPWAVPQVDAWLQAHPLLFTRAYPDQRVVSLYVDTPDFRHLRAWREGVPKRSKHRLRWYGTADRESTVQVERKARDGAATEKHVTPTHLAPHEAVVNGVPRADLIPPGYVPVVAGSYLRSYYQAQRAPLRVTVDRALTCGPASAPQQRPVVCDVIVEWKLNLDDAGVLARHRLGIPGRFVRISKYGLWADAQGGGI